MSAGPNAITLREESDDQWWDENGKDLPSFTCEECGYHGHAGDLLVEEGDATMWCPQCRLANWIWD